jgi:NADH-quinone oxidoreductase subunit M
MPRYWALATLTFFASLGLPTLAGFVSEFMSLFGAYQSEDPRFRVLVVISCLGVVMTAAYILWAVQRVFLGPLNEKYKALPDLSFREAFTLAPLLFLCVALGIFPFFLLDWMDASMTNLVDMLIAAKG